MTTDAEIACPDPHWAVKRLSKRRFFHAETTGLSAVRTSLGKGREFMNVEKMSLRGTIKFPEMAENIPLVSHDVLW